MSHSSCVDPERADMSCAHSTGRASSERNASARCGAAASAAVQRSWVAEGNLSDALSDIGRLNSRRLQKSAVPTGRCTYVLRGQLLETSRPDRPARCSRPHAAGGTHALGSSSPPYPTALRPPPPSDLDRGASRSFPPAGDRGTRLSCAEPEWLA